MLARQGRWRVSPPLEAGRWSDGRLEGSPAGRWACRSEPRLPTSCPAPWRSPPRSGPLLASGESPGLSLSLSARASPKASGSWWIAQAPAGTVPRPHHIWGCSRYDGQLHCSSQGGCGQPVVIKDEAENKAPARFGAQARSSPPWPCAPPAAAIAVLAVLRGSPSSPQHTQQ